MGLYQIDEAEGVDAVEWEGSGEEGSVAKGSDEEGSGKERSDTDGSRAEQFAFGAEQEESAASNASSLQTAQLPLHTSQLHPLHAEMHTSHQPRTSAALCSTPGQQLDEWQTQEQGAAERQRAGGQSKCCRSRGEARPPSLERGSSLLHAHVLQGAETHGPFQINTSRPAEAAACVEPACSEQASVLEYNSSDCNHDYDSGDYSDDGNDGGDDGEDGDDGDDGCGDINGQAGCADANLAIDGHIWGRSPRFNHDGMPTSGRVPDQSQNHAPGVIPDRCSDRISRRGGRRRSASNALSIHGAMVRYHDPEPVPETINCTPAPHRSAYP